MRWGWEGGGTKVPGGVLAVSMFLVYMGGIVP